MEKNGTEKYAGFQTLRCKKPGCSYLLKEIHFFENWTASTVTNNNAPFIEKNNEAYYLCPKCKAKNIIVRQGEKIILEKIIRFEFPHLNILCKMNHPLGSKFITKYDQIILTSNVR